MFDEIIKQLGKQAPDEIRLAVLKEIMQALSDGRLVPSRPGGMLEIVRLYCLITYAINCGEVKKE